jgi:hypothetical protein
MAMAEYANAFVDKCEQPADDEVAAELGRSKSVWDRLLQELAQEYQLVDREWHSYSRKAGWALRLKRGDRSIVYLGPGHGCFRVSFVLGDKAVEAARAARLPQSVLDIIAVAKRYPEGTAVRLTLSAARDLPAVKKLVEAKLGR